MDTFFFFTLQQARAASAAANRIFPPDDDSPSAADLGVVKYLDGQLAGPWGQGDRLFRQEPFRIPPDGGHGWQSPLTPSEVYAHGLAAFDELSRERCDLAFADASEEVQDEILRACESDIAVADFGVGFTGLTFFRLFRINVMEGLFADPRHHGNREYGGWRWLGFPEGSALYTLPTEGGES
jgi:gluconate 2-dehydrogenase gamma chain